MGGWTPRMRWLRVRGFLFFRLSDSEHPQDHQRHSGRDTGDEVPAQCGTGGPQEILVPRARLERLRLSH